MAQVVLDELTPNNAPLILEGATQMLRVAPDSRVIRRIIDAAQLLNQPETVRFHEVRYREAWPELHAEWLQENYSETLQRLTRAIPPAEQ
jgi:hypothetical protein